MQYRISVKSTVYTDYVVEADDIVGAIDKWKANKAKIVNSTAPKQEVLNVVQHVEPDRVVAAPTATPAPARTKPPKTKAAKATKPRKKYESKWGLWNKIPDEAVREIYQLKGIPHREIAKLYNVSNFTVSLIQRGSGRYAKIIEGLQDNKRTA